MAATPASLSLHKLRELYLAHARAYYRRRDGEPSREHLNIKAAIDRFVAHVGATKEVGRVNQHMVRAWMDQLAEEELSRVYANQCLARVRRWFQWGESRGHVPAAVTEDLRRVMPLRAFRSKAKEPQEATPPTLQEIAKVEPYLDELARDVLHLNRLTGARPSELLERTNAEILADVDNPRIIATQHKTAHHGQQRVIPLSPEALHIIGKYWRKLLPEDRLFVSPRRSRRGHYTIDGYRAAIKRACKRAGVRDFSPGKVRHSVARHVRKHAGLDAAQALLGHASAETTEIYAPLAPGQSETYQAARRATEVL